jgi:hypothetical protein
MITTAMPAVDSEVYDELATSLASDSEATAEVAAAQAPRPAPIVLSAAGPTPHGGSTEEILELEPALKRMNDAGSRSEIADAVIAYARGLFDLSVLMVVRDELALGWKGFGKQVDMERIETLLVPLGIPSMFKAALDDGDLFVGAAPPTALHAHLFKVLRTSAPRQAVVAPIVIKDRVVNLLYGHLEGDAVVADTNLAGLRKLAGAASAAYVRLIALQKQAG